MTGGAWTVIGGRITLAVSIGLVAGYPRGMMAAEARSEADGAAAEASATRPETVRVAGIVLKWVRTEKATNFARVEPMIRKAAAGGARIVCTTECFLDGYAIADKSIPLETYRALGEPVPDGPFCQRLAALADELEIHLIAGMMEADGQQRYNTTAVFGPDGKLIGKYRKQKLGHEKVRNTPGDRSRVFATPYGRVGVMICADRTEPAIVRRYFDHGADFLICPSGGMFGPVKNDPIVQSRSRENRTHILFVHPAEFLVTAPDGSILSRTILGDGLYISPEEIAGDKDLNRVFYFDLPLPPRQGGEHMQRDGSDIRYGIQTKVGGNRSEACPLPPPRGTVPFSLASPRKSGQSP